MTPIEILKDARALIERGWTQFEPARGADGVGVATMSPEATCFCAYGALRRTSATVANRPAMFEAIDALDAVAKRQGFHSIIAYNDALARTQADMVAIFSAAIAYLEDRQEAAS